uniref:MAM domain-containing protein n=1 Tax=Hucho hucho TaxID=62062 RepID=A0A4W5KY26_9TELE
MERLLTCLIAAGSLFLTVRGEVFKGDCNFERPYTACGYSQGKDDDFEWEQANTKERPSSNPWMPTGQSPPPHPPPTTTTKQKAPEKQNTFNPMTHSISICSYCVIRGNSPRERNPPTGNDCLLQIRWFLFNVYSLKENAADLCSAQHRAVFNIITLPLLGPTTHYLPLMGQ